MANYIIDQIRSAWNSSDLKSRIIYPLLILLSVLSTLISLGIYDTEKDNLFNELNIRGQAISQSLSAFASSTIEHNNEDALLKHVNRIMEQSETKPSNDTANLLHSVEFHKNSEPFLVINNDSTRARIQPDTLKHYQTAIISSDNNVIGSVRISLSTQKIDDHLAVRIFQLAFVSVLFVILTSILLSWLLDTVIIQPLERLGNKVQILINQRFNQKINTGSWDEIGNLFHDMNHLRVRMKKNQENELSDLQQELNRATNDHSSELNEHKTNTVLVIDDDRFIQIQLEKLINKNNMEVTCASNGEDALKIIKDTNIDLILLDLSMPGLSGFDVLKAIHLDDTHKNIPVIVVSSNMDKASTIKALDNGAVDYLMKPFNHDELLARINAQLKSSLREKDLEKIILSRIASLKQDENNN